MDSYRLLTPKELEALAGSRDGRYAFHRAEHRRSSRRRQLDCGHTIDAREPYRYSVAKVIGTHGLQQVYECDFCMRSSNHY